MPKTNEPKPKPWRGWAVFVRDRDTPVCWTIRETKLESLAEWMDDYQKKFGIGQSWKDCCERLGTTCRRVIVTPEEANDFR